jgi:predicted small lipoprotein YifL
MLNRSIRFAKWCFFLALLAASLVGAATAGPLYFTGTNTPWDNGTTVDWGTSSAGPYNVSTWVGGDDARFVGTAAAVTGSGNIASVRTLNFDTSVWQPCSYPRGQSYGNLQS